MFNKLKIKEMNNKIEKDAKSIIDKIKKEDMKLIGDLGDLMVSDSNNQVNDAKKEEYLSKLIIATVLTVSTSAGCPIICPPAIADEVSKLAVTKIADPVENKVGSKLGVLND